MILLHRRFISWLSKFYDKRPFGKILLKRNKTESSDKGEANTSGTAGVNLSHVVENRRK